MAKMPGHAEEYGAGKGGRGEEFFERLQRLDPMRNDFGDPFPTPQKHRLHRHSANVHPRASQGVFFWRLRIPC
jgi:hypothetical protein